MSWIKISKRPKSLIINHRLALSPWYICFLALCLFTDKSSANNSNFIKTLYGLQISNGNISHDFSKDFITQETTSGVSAAKKIDLIRYYLGAKIPEEKVSLVVDTAENFYDDIKHLWELVVLQPGKNIDQDVMLFTYNDTDCSFQSIFKDQNLTIAKMMNEIPGSKSMSKNAESILECVKLAVKMTDSDSSVMLFTGRKAGDGFILGESIGKEMKQNRVEFNCVWFTANELINNEEVNVYKEIARYTNGHFLQFSKADRNEIVVNGVNPHHRKYKTENYTKSNDFSLDVEKIVPGMEISYGDETADLLYDPKNIAYPEQPVLSTFEKSGRIMNENGRKEALEIEDMESAPLTAIDSSTLLETTGIEISAASSLVGIPGRVSRLTFTVTNNYPVTIRHYFQGRSTLFSLVYLEPRNAWIEAGQSLSVVADVLVPTTATSSTIGTVTLIVQSIGSVEKSTYIYVRETGSTIYDTVKPKINYYFNNNCAGKLGSDVCSGNLWSVDVVVQDSDSGLQRLTSTPKGIKAKTNFISGTKLSTKFQYTATCCQTSVLVTAEDLLGNSNSETIEVTVWYNLTLGEIAAIVVGTFLLLLIIILIILLIIFCIRKRREKQELPFTQRYGSRPPQARAERTSF